MKEIDQVKLILAFLLSLGSVTVAAGFIAFLIGIVTMAIKYPLLAVTLWGIVVLGTVGIYKKMI